MARLHMITGATGFVGAALVLELLQQTDDQLISIVRPGHSSAEQRFERTLEEAIRVYALPAALRAELGRCRVVAGDLLEPECGVGAAFERRVTHFWHCAASLRYENRYADEIRATNVQGTAHALELAARLGVEVFNYVSTAYVAGRKSGLIAEELAGGVDVNNQYEHSKVAAERLVANSPFTTRIFRPGIVVGHSQTLAATTFSGFYGFLRQLVQFRGMMQRAQSGLLEREPLRLRADADVGVSLGSIDRVAEEIVRVGLLQDASGVFHVTHPDPPSVGLVIRTLFRALGLHEPVFVESKDQLEWLDERFDRRLDFYGSYIIGDKRFDRRRADAALGAATPPPARFDALGIEALARWYLRVLESERAALPVGR